MRVNQDSYPDMPMAVVGLWPHALAFRLAGSAAMNLAQVACGRLDVYFEVRADTSFYRAVSISRSPADRHMHIACFETGWVRRAVGCGGRQGPRGGEGRAVSLTRCLGEEKPKPTRHREMTDELAGLCL